MLLLLRAVVALMVGSMIPSQNGVCMHTVPRAGATLPPCAQRELVLAQGLGQQRLKQENIITAHQDFKRP